MTALEKSSLIEAVIWAYRLLLGREPEDIQIISEHLRHIFPKDLEAVRRYFKMTDEYRQLPENGIDPVKHLLSNVGEPWRDMTSYPREQGFFRDLFGVRTRLSYLPLYYAQYSGGIPGDFGLDHLPMHDAVELSGMLKAAETAVGQFTIMELGAGWGPWIVMGAAIARRQRMPFRLIAIEGSDEHVGFIHSHLRDNDVDPAEHKILHGVVGAIDGTAMFQRMSSIDYGATVGEDTLDAAAFDNLPSYAVATLLRNEPIVDILHCDIQGHEMKALGAGIEALDARVRRLVVGTHSRNIEHDLHELFAAHSWHLEGDMACVNKVINDKPVLWVDGAQYWANSRLV